jgi:membrane-anchored protein YejM (alkaline phosphatase superfamily)
VAVVADQGLMQDYMASVYMLMVFIVLNHRDAVVGLVVVVVVLTMGLVLLLVDRVVAVQFALSGLVQRDNSHQPALAKKSHLVLHML